VGTCGTSHHHPWQPRQSRHRQRRSACALCCCAARAAAAPLVAPRRARTACHASKQLHPAEGPGTCVLRMVRQRFCRQMCAVCAGPASLRLYDDGTPVQMLRAGACLACLMAVCAAPVRVRVCVRERCFVLPARRNGNANMLPPVLLCANGAHLSNLSARAPAPRALGCATLHNRPSVAPPRRRALAARPPRSHEPPWPS
jgi:hypothetical protein